jgi:hypothetical protein
MNAVILMDITGSRQSYVPYTMLERAPVMLQFGRVPLTLTLSSLHACLVSVSPSYRIMDSDSPDEPCISSLVALGTSFVVAYRGEECEVRLGRKITVRDATQTGAW